jgi:fructose-1,6-bisphosphatase I
MSSSSSSSADDSMKRLDGISKNVLKNALTFTGRLRVVEIPPNTNNRNNNKNNYSKGRRNGNIRNVNDNGDDDDEIDEQDCAIDDVECLVGKSYHPDVVIAYALDQYNNNDSSSSDDNQQQQQRKRRRLAAVFDPLDGSGNADASICTGTVFGIFDADANSNGVKYNTNNNNNSNINNSDDDQKEEEEEDVHNDDEEDNSCSSVLQPGSQLLAAGYCLYSSTTILVFTLGSKIDGGNVVGFTLDPTCNEFIFTHSQIQIPKRGNIYSCNEAYVDGWDSRFTNYLRTIKNGQGQSGVRYTQRYIGSMVGDIHRTLMYGGIFCCPADKYVHPMGNLQLVYKSSPMAYIIQHAGGMATNGTINLLDVHPGKENVHVRSPCFMGSVDDMNELMKYMTPPSPEEVEVEE